MQRHLWKRVVTVDKMGELKEREDAVKAPSLTPAGGQQSVIGRALRAVTEVMCDDWPTLVC
jgi:hypothetical protein